MAEHHKDINTEQLVGSMMGIALQNSAGNLQETIRICEKQLLDIARENRDDIAAGDAYKSLAYIYTTSERFQEAIECHKKYLQIVERLHETKEMKATYYDLVSANYHIGNYQEAIEYCKKVSKLVLETGDKEAERELHDMYDMLGICYVKLNDYDKAFHYYQMCLDICKEIPDKRKELGRMNQKLGSTLLCLERYEESLPYSTKALEIAMETHDDECQAAACSDLGLYHQHQTEDFEKAVECHNKSLTLSKKINNTYGEGAEYGNLGNAYRSQCKYEKAIKFHEKQLEIAQKIGDTKLESQSYRGLGLVYKSQGKYSDALKCYEEDLRICKDAADKEGEAASYINLGSMYDILGKKPEAIVIYRKSLSLAEEMGYKEMKCKAYHNLGIAYYELSQLTESEEMLKKALADYKAVGSKRGECDIYRALGYIYRSQGDYNKAMEFLKRSFKISEETKDPLARMSAVIGIGDIHLSRNEFQKAIDYYEKGHTIAVDIKDKRNEAICYSKLGGAYSQWWIDCRLKRNDKVLEEEYLLKSIEFNKDCLRCYEWLYNNIQDDEFKISIFDDTFIRIYRTLTKHLLQRNDWVTEALLVSERGRARALECLLVTKYSINQDNTSARNDPISYNAVEQMASRLCIVFYMLDANSRFQCTWVVEPKNAFEHWQSIDEAALKGIVESAFGLKVRGVQCEDRLIHTVEHQEKPDEVVASESSPSLPESIQQRIVLEEEELYDDDYARPLEYLYKALISPVLHKLTKDEIVIIPDGPLFNVPFAALQDPDTGSFLSETKCIRLAPSLTLLKALQESPADFHSKTGALIIGNPQVGEVMFRGKKRVISGLPCAEKEAQMIGELLGVKPFIGLQATKEAIKQNLREGVAIIHFAAHGTTNGEIFLTKSTTGSLPNEQDYILTMKDVQESGVRPQLVVLSCCHSGRGDVKAEGVVGMSRAFLAAGARAVVASLWAIADEATMVFMEKFYKHLQEGESASKSLQQAMKDMRGIPRYNDPKFWAPFFLIGDDVTINI